MMRSVVNAKCVTHFAKMLGMDELDTPGKRLKWARMNRTAYKSATAAAKAFGWPVPTYLGHENGDRVPKRSKAIRYAAAYKVPWSWILEGGPLKDSRPRRLPITSAGQRLEGIRRTLCPDLPARLGISNDVVWSALIDQPGGLHPRLAALAAEITGLPLAYIEDADPIGLTREQAVALLGAFQDES